MTFEQMERTIQFILENQAESVARSAIIEENFKKLQTKLDSLTEKVDALAEKVDTLVEVTRGLVTVSQIHSRRLDRIEGIEPV